MDKISIGIIDRNAYKVAKDIPKIKLKPPQNQSNFVGLCTDKLFLMKIQPANIPEIAIQTPTNVSIVCPKPDCVAVMPIAVRTTPTMTDKIVACINLLEGFWHKKRVSEASNVKPAK